MIRLDRRFLAEVGLGRLPDNLGEIAAAGFYAVLEHRVGLRLAAGLDDEVLADFEEIAKRGDDEAGMRWFEEHVPDYRDTVAEEFALLRSRLAAAHPWLLAASGS